jgi:hypothetical protein
VLTAGRSLSWATLRPPPSCYLVTSPRYIHPAPRLFSSAIAIRRVLDCPIIIASMFGWTRASPAYAELTTVRIRGAQFLNR